MNIIKNLSKILFFIILIIPTSSFSAEPIDWRQQARFYESNYPNCSANEKAEMLYNSIIRNNERGAVLEKRQQVIETYYVFNNGIQIWPVKKVQSKNSETIDQDYDETNYSHTIDTRIAELSERLSAL